MPDSSYFFLAFLADFFDFFGGGGVSSYGFLGAGEGGADFMAEPLQCGAGAQQVGCGLQQTGGAGAGLQQEGGAGTGAQQLLFFLWLRKLRKLCFFLGLQQGAG